MTPDETEQAMQELMSTNGGYWGEHPQYPVSDWVWNSKQNYTRLGYWEWVLSNLEAEEI